MNKLKFLWFFLGLISLVSCEYQAYYSYRVKNKLKEPIRVEFKLPPELFYNAYEDALKDIDTLLNPMESILIYEQSGGIVCMTCEVSDHRDDYWDIDSLSITTDAGVTYEQFKESHNWIFSADKASGYYKLIMDESKFD